MCRGPITSVEWCPYESSMLATTSADGRLCCWDLAVERDPEEEVNLADSSNANAPSDLPPQLLFEHGGQQDIKEASHLHSSQPLTSAHLPNFLDDSLFHAQFKSCSRLYKGLPPFLPYHWLGDESSVFYVLGDGPPHLCKLGNVGVKQLLNPHKVQQVLAGDFSWWDPNDIVALSYLLRGSYRRLHSACHEACSKTSIAFYWS